MLNKHTATFINELLQSKQQRAYKKARCALEFYFMLDIEIVFSSTTWANRWKVSRGTAHEWCKQFKEEYSKQIRF
jgi:hypothetical protein